MSASFSLRPLLGLVATVSLSAGPVVPAAPVTVSPQTATLRTGQTKTFAATVKIPNNSNENVVWSVNGVVGGNSSAGTISTAGVYTTPASVPSPNTVPVKATSVADSTKFGTATVTLQNPLPVFSSLDTNKVNTGLAYTLHLKGSGFLPSSKVMWDREVAASTFVSGTDLTISGTTTAAAGTSVSITLVNPDPGGATSSAHTVTVLAPVTVTLNTDKRTVRAGSTYDFNSTVHNNSNQAVTWSATLGTIDASGLYKAPVVLPANTPTVMVKQ
jgi:hypothetical protein